MANNDLHASDSYRRHQQKKIDEYEKLVTKLEEKKSAVQSKIDATKEEPDFDTLHQDFCAFKAKKRKNKNDPDLQRLKERYNKWKTYNNNLEKYDALNKEEEELVNARVKVEEQVKAVEEKKMELKALYDEVLKDMSIYLFPVTKQEVEMRLLLQESNKIKEYRDFCESIDSYQDAWEKKERKYFKRNGIDTRCYKPQWEKYEKYRSNLEKYDKLRKEEGELVNARVRGLCVLNELEDERFHYCFSMTFWVLKEAETKPLEAEINQFLKHKVDQSRYQYDDLSKNYAELELKRRIIKDLYLRLDVGPCHHIWPDGTMSYE